jgi:cyclopropane fatty-acyl-phospholipid synthase-like methyltransferase
MNHSNHDHNHYTLWRKSRITKLEQIFGKEYFRNKSVLEVAAGNGKIGKFLCEEWGANVTFTDGRQALIDEIKQNNPESRAILVDHDAEWDLGERFDFIIHWGLLYHLDNWQQDLRCTINHLKLGGVLALESEVIDSSEDEEIKSNEPASMDDQSLYGLGTYPSALRVENQLKKMNLEFKRYDDTDLNADFHHYDWVLKNTMKFRCGQRRFWIVS